jgi:hypothetical protein
MNLSPLSAESESNLEFLYCSVKDKYFIFNTDNNFLGLKSLELNPRIVEPSSSHILEIEFNHIDIINFIKAYRDHYMWFHSSPVERITHKDKIESTYSPLWTLLDNFFEDAGRQYQRLFNLTALFGMFEVFDVCSDSSSLNRLLSDTLEVYNIVCLANFSSNSIKNFFISYPQVEFKPNFVYLFPSYFTHKVNLSPTDEDLFVFVGGLA